MVDSGVLTVYTLENTAENGRMPVEELVSSFTAFYSERSVGVTRLYAAIGVNQRIDMLVRIWNVESMPTGALFCIPEDGNQYRITLAQRLPDLGAYDLTLERLDDFYDVAE